MNTAVAAWSGLKRPQKAASKAYADAFRAVFAAIEALRAEPDPAVAAGLQQQAHARVDARDQAKAALAASSPAHAVFEAARPAQDAYLAAAEALLDSRRAVATTKAQSAAAEDPTGVRSARLQRFVEFVNANRIQPFTKYARDNWPAAPEEFYAEAFSFWRADPTFLGSAAPGLKAWFDSGEHRR
jgi:hypothetical protein